MNYKKAEKIVNKYTIPTGVAGTQIEPMLKELGLNKDRFNEFMFGQTCGMIGNESIYYLGDILRFVNKEL